MPPPRRPRTQQRLAPTRPDGSPAVNRAIRDVQIAIARIEPAVGQTSSPTTEVLTADGTASADVEVTFVSGTGTDVTLPDGSSSGFVKWFVVRSGTGSLVPRHLGGATSIMWAAAGAVALVWDQAQWRVVSTYNVTVT